MTVVGPRNGTAGQSNKSCETVRYVPKRGDYMTWLGAAPGMDLTSNFADVVVRYNGDGSGGCFGVAHKVGTSAEGRCCIWVDPWRPGFLDVADELWRELDGNSNCRAGWCYFSLNALRHVSVHFAAGA